MKTILALLCLMFSCQIAATQNFTDVAAQINVNASYGWGSFGGGISFADFNQDGWDDLTFASNNGQPIYFFLNNQGTYVQTNLTIFNTQETKQVIWVDFDNDGDKDFFCTSIDGNNRLYRKDLEGYTDISQSAGVTGAYDARSYGACFGDYNNDGWLDLYVANREYFETDPTNYLYTNNGDGTFTLNEFSTTNNGVQPSFAPVFFDADGNGWQDIFLAQDRLTYPNALYMNYNGVFVDESIPAGVDHLIDGMNAGIADYDNDMDLDIYVTNTLGGNLLLNNDGAASFTDVATSAGVVANHIGWSANFLDAENDGDLDLYVSSSTQNGTNMNRFFTNSGNGTFTENAAGGLPGDNLSSNGNAIGDFNNDGQMDIAVSNTSPNHFVWRNDNNANNNWIKIDLQGTISNRDGIGSWVEIYAGNDSYLRYKHCGEAYLAQNADYLHVGLGDHTQISEIKVKWLSGIVTSIYNVGTNQRIQIVESNTPLALDIIDFEINSIEENAFNLSWQLEGIQDGHQVILQKSITDNDFEDILLVNKKSAYRDWEVQQNLEYYYRLKIVDRNEAVQYSDIINASLNIRSGILYASIFPNPTDHHLNLQINARSKGAIYYKIIDTSGKILHTFDNTLEVGNNDFQIDMSTLSPNNYFLQMEFNGAVILRPFTKI